MTKVILRVFCNESYTLCCSLKAKELRYLVKVKENHRRYSEVGMSWLLVLHKTDHVQF